MVFHQMDTKEVSDRFVAPCFVNGMEAYDGEINLGVAENMISNEYAVNYAWNMRTRTVIIYPEFNLFLEDIKEEEKSMDDWDHFLDFNLDDIPLLAGGHLTQEEVAKEALAIRISQKWKDCKRRGGSSKRIKGEALKEKDDTGAFIFPIRLEEKVNENALANTRSDINTMSYGIYKQLGREEMKKVDRGITIISHTQEEAMGILINVLCQGFTTKKTDRKLSKYHKLSDVMSPNDAKSRYNTRLAQLLPRHVYSLCVMNWDVLNRMGYNGEIGDMLRIKLRDDKSKEEIFTSVAWIRAFNINELIYVELWYEFYLTYEFNEVCADDELQSKKIIKFRLGGRAYNLTLLEFAHRLGLYHTNELEEYGFNVYFEGGLRSDEHFNAHEYWLSISQEENLGLSRSHTSTIKSPILRVIHKIITYGLCQMTTGYANVAWLIARWMKRKGPGTQKGSQICYGQFISKIARNSKVLTDEVIRSLSTPIYCRDLDTTPLIDYEGKLIPEDPQWGVPRVGIPRPPKASMQDLYNRMGRMEIRQEVIERMEYL
ncbi:hypothetical protein Tco_1062936 [Tanacetum coccineum]